MLSVLLKASSYKIKSQRVQIALPVSEVVTRKPQNWWLA